MTKFEALYITDRLVDVVERLDDLRKMMQMTTFHDQPAIPTVVSCRDKLRNLEQRYHKLFVLLSEDE